MRAGAVVLVRLEIAEREVVGEEFTLHARGID